MIIKRLLTLLLVLSVLTSFGICNAEERRAVDVDVNDETRALSMVGEGWAIPGANLTIEILKPQKVFANGSDPNDVFIHIDQIGVETDGGFTYSCTLPANAASGKYTAKFFAYGDADRVTQPFNFINLDNRAAAILDMQTANKEGIKAILDVSMVDFDVDVADAYANFNDARKLYIASELYNNMSADFTSIMEVINVCMGKLEILDIMQTDTRANAKKALDDNMTLLGITDSTALGIYGNQKYTDKVVISFIDAIKDEKTTPDMLPSKFVDVCDIVKKSVDKANQQSNKKDKETSRNDSFAFGGGSSAVKDAPLPVPESQERFSDMSGFDWAKNAVYKLTDKGIINGKTNQNFSPADQITREEFVKLIYVAFNIDPSSKEAEFADVEKDAWYYEYVAALTEKGIINGVSEAEFGVGVPISRQDMATILYRTVEYEKYDMPVVRDEAMLNDIDNVSDYAKEAITMLNRCNAVNGNEEKMFLPLNYTTRAEAAQMLYNMLYVLNIL